MGLLERVSSLNFFASGRATPKSDDNAPKNGETTPRPGDNASEKRESISTPAGIDEVWAFYASLSDFSSLSKSASFSDNASLPESILDRDSISSSSSAPALISASPPEALLWRKLTYYQGVESWVMELGRDHYGFPDGEYFFIQIKSNVYILSQENKEVFDFYPETEKKSIAYMGSICFNVGDITSCTYDDLASTEEEVSILPQVSRLSYTV